MEVETTQENRALGMKTLLSTAEVTKGTAKVFLTRDHDRWSKKAETLDESHKECLS